MFENYIHTKEDLEAVEEALEYLERSELDFIFKDRSLINNTLIISYDSKELFIWTKLKHPKLQKMPCRVKEYNAYRLKHQLKISDKDQMAFSCRVRPKGMVERLPERFRGNQFEIPKISGGLLTPFIKIHEKQRKNGRRPLDPYSTRESYLTTVVHEFGHVYYNQRKLWYYSDKAETTGYMQLALDLYQGKATADLRKISLKLPVYGGVTEIFAFCTDYTTAKLFWPSHKADIDKEATHRIKMLIKKEKKLNLDYQDSIFSEVHNAATVLGKIITERYPNDWPNKILELGKA